MDGNETGIITNITIYCHMFRQTDQLEVKDYKQKRKVENKMQREDKQAEPQVGRKAYIKQSREL